MTTTNYRADLEIARKNFIEDLTEKVTAPDSYSMFRDTYKSNMSKNVFNTILAGIYLESTSTTLPTSIEQWENVLKIYDNNPSTTPITDKFTEDDTEARLNLERTYDFSITPEELDSVLACMYIWSEFKFHVSIEQLTELTELYNYFISDYTEKYNDNFIQELKFVVGAGSPTENMNSERLDEINFFFTRVGGIISNPENPEELRFP